MFLFQVLFPWIFWDTSGKDRKLPSSFINFSSFIRAVFHIYALTTVIQIQLLKLLFHSEIFFYVLKYWKSSAIPASCILFHINLFVAKFLFLCFSLTLLPDNCSIYEWNFMQGWWFITEPFLESVISFSFHKKGLSLYHSNFSLLITVTIFPFCLCILFRASQASWGGKSWPLCFF